MKQLTMTKVLTPLAALAFAFGVQAAVSTDGFESYTAGTTVITNQTGWSFTYGADGADDASAVTAYDNNAPSVFPDGTTAGSNYLKLSTEDGMLFRNMDGANGDTVQLDAGLYVDTDVQFTITDPSDRPEVTGDDKFIVWLEADGAATNLCAWAGYYDASGNLSSNVYSLADTDGSPIAIAPNSWHRLTVKAIANINAGGTALPGFQVYVDGHLFATEAFAVDSTYEGNLAQAAQDLIDAKTFLPSMTAMASLSKVGFSGEGALDNVVVTKEVPGFMNPATLTFAWESDAITSVALTDLNLALTAPGSVRVDPSAASLTVAISGTNLANYNWAIDGVAIDNPASFTITPSTKTYTITATAKDTVAVTFTLDSTWNDYLADISSVMIGDLDVTADIAFGAAVNLKVGTNVTVVVNSSPAAALTLTTSSGNLTVNGTSVTVDTFASAAAVSIVRATTAATVNGQPYGSFADALSAAATAGTATIALAADATVDNAAIAAGKDITIDLAGHDITGAANAATVFSVADGGTLTITNSTVTVGVVSKGDATACISNAGTLNLQAGKFDIANGAISGGTINVTGGAYNADTFTGATLPEGMELAQDTGAQDAYAYVLAVDNSVARIDGGAKYETLQAAVDAAVAGDTVRTLKDCTISTPLSIAKNITVHNDYTITGAVNYAICIGATVSFEGSGKIERASTISGSAFCVGANETTRGAITAGTAGTLNFTGLTVCGGNGGNLIKLENGTVNMNGGVLRDGLRGIKADADAGSYTSAIVINDGTITNCSIAILASAESATGTATLTVNGGVICGPLDDKAGDSKQHGIRTITIPGTSTAQFDRDQSAFCAPGYETTQDNNGWFVVTEKTGTPVAPGAQDVTEYDSEAAATAQAGNIVITPTAAVAAVAGSDYVSKFEVKAVQKDNGKWVLEVALKDAVKADLQTQANADAATIAAGITGSSVTLTTTRGFYYSIKSGTALDGMTEGARVLAGGESTAFTLPKSGTAGFYKVLINIAPAE